MQDFYRCLEGYEDATAECAMFTCQKLVTDMIYESHISQNVAYKAKYGEKVKKGMSETCASLQNKYARRWVC
jgi:hypothetical protein